MNANVIKLSMQEIAQTLLDQQYGQGKALACENNMIKFLFCETYNGCNEMEVGSWKILKGKLTMYVFMSYEEAFENHRVGIKPSKYAPIYIDLSKLTGPLKQA